ncbi:hypothetical protein [Micromonospora chokoriensis]|uniref:hypothetical protein n=1 Tax=Micromonospora chokoriensis TaxID=356851 RepID=UPI0005616B54|nr:hypothetical protein [Micromonospora chokoriensis]
MKTVGFFRELGPNQTEVYVESIHTHVNAEPLPDAVRVEDYLRHGHGLIAVMGAEIDVLGSGRHLVGGASILTDGEWLWRDDLRYYLATYRVQLPTEFLETVRGNDYRMPDLRADQLRLVGEEATRILGYH